MLKIKNLHELFKIIENSKDNEWVYANNNDWKENPKTCSFHIISEEEVENLTDEEVYESESGPLLPLEVKDLNLHPWMQIDMLQGVMLNLKLNSNNFEDNKFIIGINYFRENDDFLDA